MHWQAKENGMTVRLSFLFDGARLRTKVDIVGLDLGVECRSVHA
jgi:hypothetical protein